MACGIPQVVADWDGYRDTVSHGETGFRVPTYWTKCDSDLADTGHLLGWEFDHLALGQSVAIDMDSLQSYLQMVIENEQLRQMMSERSRKRAENLYSFPAVVRQYEELWSELSIRARGLSLTTIGADFGRPQYFECFKDHSTSVLTDDSGLNLTLLGREVKDKDLLSLLHPKVSAWRTIDHDLVRLALGKLKASSNSNGSDGQPAASVRFGELVASLTKGAFHPDYVRRNVMWLMKHGFVTPDIPNARELPGMQLSTKSAR
jgi:hypothetical protein